MPESKVGSLSAELKANIAAFTANMKAAGFASEGFADSMTAAGQKFSEAGVRFSATNKLVADFQGTLDKRKAEEYAAAVEKIGGAAKLTEADQAKVNKVMADALAHYKALGQEAPAHMVALEKATKQASESTDLLGGSVGKLFTAFTAAGIADKVIDSVVEFGKAAIDNAGHLVDLSNKTGLSLETLQRMQFVAAQTGTTVDAFSDSVFKLGVNVQKGGAETKAAVDKMGVSWSTFKAMRPEDQFKTIVEHLDAFGSVTERNTALVALFGKGAAETIPGIVDDYARLASQAKIAGDEQIKALDAATDAWDAFVANTKTKMTSMLGSWVMEMKLFKTDFFEVMKGEVFAPDFTKFITDLANAREQLDSFGKHAANFKKDVDLPVIVPPNMTADLAAARKELNALNAEQVATIKSGLDLGRANDKIAESANTTADVIELFKQRLQEQKDAATKAETANKAYNKAVEDLEAKMQNANAAAFPAFVKGLHDVALYSTPALAATKALAEANRELSPEVQKSVRNMIDAGYSANEAYKYLKDLGQVSEEDARAVETFGSAYKKLEDDFKTSA